VREGSLFRNVVCEGRWCVRKGNVYGKVVCEGR